MKPKLYAGRIVIKIAGEVVVYEKGQFDCSQELCSEIIMSGIRREMVQIYIHGGRQYECTFETAQGIAAMIIATNPPGARLIEGPKSVQKMWDRPRGSRHSYVDDVIALEERE